MNIVLMSIVQPSLERLRESQNREPDVQHLPPTCMKARTILTSDAQQLEIHYRSQHQLEEKLLRNTAV